MSEHRAPCPHCGTLVVAGARKCRGCFRWLGEPPPRSRGTVGRALWLLVSAIATLAMGWVLRHESPVGDAPPLTPMPAGSAEAVAPMEQGPAALGPDEADVVEPLVLDDDDVQTIEWRTRRLRTEVRPLDVVFHPDGESLFVSGDDATLRQYDLSTGKLMHMTAMPARGDRLEVLFGRYVALIRLEKAAHIPIVDTENWDREPLLLWVGSAPADIVEMSDGETVITASRRGKRLSAWNLRTRRRTADLRLPHATRQLLMLQLDGRPYIGAMGTLRRGGRDAGAWLDLFDPKETPFGATRRSVSVGRAPRAVVGGSGDKVLFADEAANAVGLLELSGEQRPKLIPVGRAPVSAHFMRGERYGVTLDAEARTATVIDVPHAKRLNTLMLPGVPRHGAVSADGKWLFVSLGGRGSIARDRGLAIIADDPLEVVAELDTELGAGRVATSPSGHRAAVTAYLDRSITIVEPRPDAR